MSAELKAILAVNVAPAAAVTTNTNSTGIDLRAYDGEIELILNAAAAAGGGSNTLDVKIQESDDNSTFADAGVAFTQVTSGGASFQRIRATAKQFKRYIRAVSTVAGTTPSCVRSVSMIARTRM